MKLIRFWLTSGHPKAVNRWLNGIQGFDVEFPEESLKPAKKEPSLEDNIEMMRKVGEGGPPPTSAKPG